MENKDKFEYTYSAPQNHEIMRIREKYLPRKESKLELLRRLDESTTRKGLALSLTLGILSSLLFGGGVCCVLLWGGSLVVPGLCLCVIGMVGIAMAQPLYKRITREEQKKIAPEILRLTTELLNRTTT